MANYGVYKTYIGGSSLVTTRFFRPFFFNTIRLFYSHGAIDVRYGGDSKDWRNLCCIAARLTKADWLSNVAVFNGRDK
jgi:hypothetical protein